jgi:hypothetical protein
MLAFPKRAVLAVALPLGALAIFGGSVAFAQAGGDGSSSSTPSQAPSPTPDGATPTTPTTPGAPHQPGDNADCPNMGGSGSTTGTSFHRMRGPSGSSTLQ